MKLRYKGTSDVRVLEAKDLDKLGVEGFRKTTFNRGETVEVPDEAAEQLLDHEWFTGEFEEVTDDEDSAGSSRSARAVEPDVPDLGHEGDTSDPTVTTGATSTSKASGRGSRGGTTRRA